MQRRVLQALIAIGVFGFLATSTLPFAGTWLKRIELPTFFETSTIALPDGGRLTATMPTQRVQRYSSDGRFLTGWFVHANGGHFAIGLTRDGKVAVCTGPGRQISIFEPDGTPVGDPRPCIHAPREVPKILQPADFPLGEVALQPAVRAERPMASLSAVLLVPFWHPFVAWSMALVGYLALRLGHRAQEG